MNTLAISMLIALNISAVTPRPLINQGIQRARPTKLAHYEMGAYMDVKGKLHVNVDKQLGGEVHIQLNDRKGQLYFDRTMYAADTTVRFLLDLSDLTEGDYTLKVSNGLEMMIREIKISPHKITPVTRTITVL
ncbi:hypothetical protein HNV11_18765 [Spirosoma taeanense]|uniref:Uncharacterized protein n=1 Tax=Spirosoma taeanense TaxID=2735870 RepID=A0A6M5YE69_9BACT|nr:hypothetical protein [Spirosoma taeanense]QJW91272.1 hypothetical protein HNV11_18765 [Spirosoma taeanense]